MSKHTPGPWYIRKYGIETKIVGMEDTHITHLTGNDTKANANLIAAAPDLLEACKEAIWCAQEMRNQHVKIMLEQEGPDAKDWVTDRCTKVESLLKEAIKKAEGE